MGERGGDVEGWVGRGGQLADGLAPPPPLHCFNIPPSSWSSPAPFFLLSLSAPSVYPFVNCANTPFDQIEACKQGNVALKFNPYLRPPIKWCARMEKCVYLNILLVFNM